MELETSSEDLRAKLYRSLKDRGVLDSLKSHMRNKLATELQRSTVRAKRSSSKTSPSPAMERREGASLSLQIANSLVARHLKEAGYEYSLSVFLPETGLNMEQLFGENDLMKFLKTLPSPDMQHQGFLVRLVEELHSHSGSGGSKERSTSQASQTDHKAAGKATIAARLQALDASYAEKMAEESTRCRQNLEQRLATVQHELEAHYKHQLALEVSLFQERELPRVRAEEKEAHSRQLELEKSGLSCDYHGRVEALRKQELQMMERLRRKEQDLESSMHSQRQTLLKELDLIRARETDLKKQAEVNKRALGLEEEHVRSLAEQLANKERALEIRKEHLEQASEQKIKRYRLQCEQETRSKCEDIAQKEARMETERYKLSALQESNRKLSSELGEERSKVERGQGLLCEATARQITLQREGEAMEQKLAQMVDYHQLKEKCHVTERKLSNVKTEYKHRSSEQQQLIKQLRAQLSKKSQDSLSTLQAEINQLQQSHHKEVAVMELENQHLQDQLEQQTSFAHAMQGQADEQMVQLMSAQREVADLHSMLQHLQEAKSLQHRGASASERSVSLGKSRASVSSPKPLRSVKSPPKSHHHPHTITTAHKPHPPQSHTHFSHTSSKLLTETRAIFDRLEKEAKELEQSYYSLHTRTTSPLTSPTAGALLNGYRSPSPEFDLHSPSRLTAPVPAHTSSVSVPLSRKQSSGSASKKLGLQKHECADLSAGKTLPAYHTPSHYNGGGLNKDLEHTTLEPFPRVHAKASATKIPATLRDESLPSHSNGGLNKVSERMTLEPFPRVHAKASATKGPSTLRDESLPSHSNGGLNKVSERTTLEPFPRVLTTTPAHVHVPSHIDAKPSPTLRDELLTPHSNGGSEGASLEPFQTTTPVHPPALIDTTDTKPSAPKASTFTLKDGSPPLQCTSTSQGDAWPTNQPPPASDNEVSLSTSYSVAVPTSVQEDSETTPTQLSAVVSLQDDTLTQSTTTALSSAEPSTEKGDKKLENKMEKVTPVDSNVEQPPPTQYGGPTTSDHASSPPPLPISLDDLWKARKEASPSKPAMNSVDSNTEPTQYGGASTSDHVNNPPISLDDLWKARKEASPSKPAMNSWEAPTHQEEYPQSKKPDGGGSDESPAAVLTWKEQLKRELEAEQRRRQEEEKQVKLELELLEKAERERKQEMQEKKLENEEKNLDAKESESTAEKEEGGSGMDPPAVKEEGGSGIDPPAVKEEGGSGMDPPAVKEEGGSGMDPPAVKEEGGSGMDPLMLKYIELVRQKRANEDLQRQTEKKATQVVAEEDEYGMPLLSQASDHESIEGYSDHKSEDHDPFADW